MAKWVTIKEATRTTGKADRTIRRPVAAGKIPHKHDGRRVLVIIARSKAEMARMSREGTRLEETPQLARQELEDWKGQVAALTADQQKQIEVVTEEKSRHWWKFWR